METIEEKIKKFLVLTDGSGYGYGYGDGYGYGYGDGYGCGDGNGYGYGSGNGDGDGDGNGYGNGDGDGDGNGYCISSFNGHNIHIIDGIPTIIISVHGNVARGFILYDDFTQSECYIVKNDHYFTHGEDLKSALKALNDKIFENMDTEGKIAKFIETFDTTKRYKGQQFYDWHHLLTGSCEMGRQSFIRNKGLSLDAEYTVAEFIALCENDYGENIIKNLKEKIGL